MYSILLRQIKLTYTEVKETTYFETDKKKKKKKVRKNQAFTLLFLSNQIIYLEIPQLISEGVLKLEYYQFCLPSLNNASRQWAAVATTITKRVS